MKKLLFLVFFFSLQWSINAQENVDDFWQKPQAGYAERIQAGLSYIRDNSTKTDLYGIFNQLARAGLGEPVEEEYIQKAIAVIRTNRDCNDFVANGLLRLAYVDKEKNLFPESLKKQTEACLLDFKYWWDDARKDTTYRCYHTENHQALYHTAELLAGQLYKNKVFTNGMTGEQHIRHAKERLERWLDFRFRFGFSEWLSSYYDVEVMLLANLYDYAEDEQIRSRAGLVLDMLMFDMALNNYRGTLGSTSGRIYVYSLIKGNHQLSSVNKLVFGTGRFLPDNSMGIVTLALSSYQCPEVIQEIALDSQTILNKQRSSIEVEDAPKYGLSYDKELDTHVFWAMQEFIHPFAIHMSKQLSEKYGTWPYNGANYEKFIRQYEEEKKEYGKVINMRTDMFALSEANIQTYRTPDYMLSSVQDYRKGAQGYQQHVWQATFDNKALVYTNYPGAKNLRSSPNYWAGNPTMPRAAQYENVLICIYNVEKGSNDFTHAYFPRKEFDEVIEKGNWVFARKNDGYLALYSKNETQWNSNEDGIVNDLIAQGKQNTWICETGSKKQWKSFEKFIHVLSNSKVETNGLQVNYQSPSKGNVKFGWTEAFTIKGKSIPLRYEYQYDNSYCKKAFNSRRMEIKKGKKKLILDFERPLKNN